MSTEETSGEMIKLKRTRYFTVTRINPTSKDIQVFVEGCKTVGAEYYGYHVTNVRNDRQVLRGFFVLTGQANYSCYLEGKFPNFLVTQMPNTMDADLDYEVLPDTLVISGEHPFRDLKINMFEKHFNKMH